MKKFLAGLIILFVFVISVPVLADAQCRNRRSYSSRRYNRSNNYNRSNYRNVNRSGYDNSYNRRSYSTSGYTTYYQQRPSFYRQHRNLINLGIGTGGGALIGALTGGRRGSLIGTAIGAGGGALYTYVLNPKKRRYYRR